MIFKHCAVCNFKKNHSLVLAQQKKQFISDWISYFFFCTNISFHGSSTDPIFLNDPILWKYQDGYKTIFDNHWFWRKGHLELGWRFRPSNMENCSPWVCILGESRFKITVVVEKISFLKGGISFSEKCFLMVLSKAFLMQWTSLALLNLIIIRAKRANFNFFSFESIKILDKKILKMFWFWLPNLIFW